MNILNNDYDVVSDIDAVRWLRLIFSILSCPIRKLKILRLSPLIFKKYLAVLFWALKYVHLCSVLKSLYFSNIEG